MTFPFTITQGGHLVFAAAAVPLSVDDSYFAVNTTNSTSYTFTTDISPGEGDHVLIILATQNNSGNGSITNVQVDGNAVTIAVAEFSTSGETVMSAYIYEVGAGGLVNPDITFDLANGNNRLSVAAYDVSGDMSIGYKDHGAEDGAAGDNSFDIDVDEGGIAIGLYWYWGNTSNRTFTGLTNDEHATAANVRCGNGHVDDLSNDDTYTVSCNNDNGQDNSLLFVVSFI